MKNLVRYQVTLSHKNAIISWNFCYKLACGNTRRQFSLIYTLSLIFIGTLNFIGYPYAIKSEYETVQKFVHAPHAFILIGVLMAKMLLADAGATAVIKCGSVCSGILGASFKVMISPCCR